MISDLIRKLYHQKIFSTVFPTTVSCLQKELADCDKVLDLGCGPDSPIQYCTNIKDSVGVEAYKPYLQSSKNKRIHTRYLNQNILKVDFPKNSFDAVIMTEVLEHLTKEDGQKILARAKRWAKKKVIITTPNGFVKQASLDGNKLQNHLSGWSVSALKKLGFRVHGLSGLKFLCQEASNNSMGDDLTVSIRFQPKLFWFVIASLSQSVTYHLPESSFELFSVYIKNKGRNLKRKYGENYYTNYSFGFSATNRHDHRRIIDIIKKYKPKRIVDIGCGLGVLLDLIPLPSRCKFGLESNKYAADICKKRGLKVIVHNDIRSLPYPDKYFDFVILNEVIEHVVSPTTLLNEVHRILKEKGLVVVTTPNKNILVRNIDETHISELSYNELEETIKNTGFRTIKHEVSGFCLYDYLGRKLFFPIGKKLAQLPFLNRSVSNVRHVVDHSQMSHFRANFVYFGAQQLLLARKRS